VLLLRKVPRQDVELATVFRAVGGDFLAEKGVVGVPGLDFNRALDRVVVGDRHEVHAARLGGLVELFRIGETLRCADTTEDPFRRFVGIARVNMHVGLGFHRLNSAGLCRAGPGL